MKVKCSPYQLHYLSRRASREGALLRVEFPDGQVGYADCHPWDFAGDKPLSEQLQLLSDGLTTSLTARSLHFAKIDADARARKINLFTHLAIPKSHFLIADLLSLNEKVIVESLKSGITHFKIKLGNNLNIELPLLIKLFNTISGSHAKVRLDFNLQLTRQEFEEFLRKISKWKELVDFFEDPYAFDVQAWSQHQSNDQVVFAADFDSERAIPFPETAQVIVLKPANQDEKSILECLQSDRRLVVTSYLDHPLGQLTAAYVAGLCAKQLKGKIDICGLMSHLVYEKNEFSELLPKSGPDLIPPQGTGFGFDELLMKQVWKVL